MMSYELRRCFKSVQSALPLFYLFRKKTIMQQLKEKELPDKYSPAFLCQ